MKRSTLTALSLLSLPLLAAAALPAAATSQASSHSSVLKNSTATIDEPFCESNKSTCADAGVYAAGRYVGHDEPSVEFKSGIRGSGNDMTYIMTLPRDPKVQPNATGAGGTTWNFELRPTFWFGLTMCDSQPAPEFTTQCTPDSDSNNLVGSNPNAPDYIGKHPGTAFMELQFYGPGYVPQFEGFGCTATQYCAAMTIDSLVRDQNTGVSNTSACNNFLLGGVEPINTAYITRNGVSQAPANPLFTGTFSNPNFSAVNPNTAEDLLMNPGDRIKIHMHDTPAGFRVDMTDLSTGQHGSMTASIANGFGHILYTPSSSTCTEAPYAFHPEYSTANPRGTIWAAHTYNVAMSDEVGHFENCLAIDASGNCTSPGSQDATVDADDTGCVPGTDSTLVKIDGCFTSDEDFDGQTYRNDWPGTNPNPFLDRALHPTPVLFTSPLTRGKNYSTVAFETDLPAIEIKGAQANPPFCDPVSGANCVNPPAGAQFYPFFSTTFRQGGCAWQEGGAFIPGTVNNFGGSSTAEFGPLLATLYPEPGFTTATLKRDFNSGDIPNPCRRSE
ncbi:MAG TPA: hypothetical protein VF070_35405 [Streptosporangiaceae bacterium]